MAPLSHLIRSPRGSIRRGDAAGVVSEGRRRAFTVSDPSALARRMRDAFAQEFKSGGGYHIADYAYAGDGAGLERLRQAAATGTADMLFVAVDAARFRALRAVTSMIAAYGTSQLNPGLAAGFRQYRGCPTCASSTCRGWSSPIIPP